MKDGSQKERPTLVNVPVIWPSGGGITHTFTLKSGDTVWLAFSERGLTEFKKSFAQAPPDRNHLFSLSDAVAVGGFGAQSIEPASLTGSSWQTEDGKVFVKIEDGVISLKAPTIKLQSNEICIDDPGVERSERR